MYPKGRSKGQKPKGRHARRVLAVGPLEGIYSPSSPKAFPQIAILFKSRTSKWDFNFVNCTVHTVVSSMFTVNVQYILYCSVNTVHRQYKFFTVASSMHTVIVHCTVCPVVSNMCTEQVHCALCTIAFRIYTVHVHCLLCTVVSNMFAVHYVLYLPVYHSKR